jgi:hypothetical protein
MTTAMMDNDIPIVKSTFFDIVMQRSTLVVVSIPPASIFKCSWWLFREFGLVDTFDVEKSTHAKGFGSLLFDDDGLSVIFEENKLIMLKYLLKPNEFTLSSFYWKAFIISFKGSGIEVPGLVYYLANALSNDGLSILHISTFDSEVFLIQENDLEKACKILKEFEDPLRIQEMLEYSYNNNNNIRNSEGEYRRSSLGDRSSFEQLRNSRDELDSSASYDDESDNNNEDDNHFGSINLDLAWITPQVKSTISLYTLNDTKQLSSSLRTSKAKFDEGFMLSVLSQPLMLAKCSFTDMRKCSDFMVRKLLSLVSYCVSCCFS